MFYAIIQEKTREWAESADCPARPVIDYIRQRGKLRETQIAAIETYLFLKIEGRGRPLAQLFSEGFFNVNEDLGKLRISQSVRERLTADPAALALFQLCCALEKGRAGTRNRGIAEAFERHLEAVSTPEGFTEAIHKIFYQANYADYLFSLPMGAGKTFLMAAFIYLDLHFALNEPENTAFARNFIVLAPSGLKSSIIPSLRTIERFDPSWVLPEPTALEIRKHVKFEVLDQPRSAQKSNRARNPNVQKVAAHRPFDDLFGLVLVVNAEKVILDRVEVDDNFQLIERNEEEKERFANELRHLIGQIPRLQVFIDEVQRAASGDIKLRAVVNNWCRAGGINAVLGFSGTPYHDALRRIQTGPVEVQSTTIANTVYYYPLSTAIAQFLKKPKLDVAAGLQAVEIVRTGVNRFLEAYGDKVYANGACAKLAIYCGTIDRLEEEVYPMLVGDLGLPPGRILKFHQGNKRHPIDKAAAAEFALLDDPASRKQIVLLVQIGKEGWDCRSLTGVILSQEGDCPRNMVLQTSCRCLRQVDGGLDETAFILLNEANAKILDKQLAEEQNTSIRELNEIQKSRPDPMVERRSRMEQLQLPPVSFYQLRIDYHATVTDGSPDAARTLAAFDPDLPAFKSVATVTTRYLDARQAADNQAFDLVRETEMIASESGGIASFSAWINDLARESLGDLAIADLRDHAASLKRIFARITFTDKGCLRYNTLFDQGAIRSAIRLAFHVHRELECREEVVRKEASLLLVDALCAIPERKGLWPDAEKRAAILRLDEHPETARGVDPVELEQKRRDAEETAKSFGNPALADMLVNQWLESRQTADSVSAMKEHTLHYLPYDFGQSDFERKIIDGILRLGAFKTGGLDVYYNGERSLTGFKIDCYARTGRAWLRVGFYTPDFLVVQRKRKAIHKVLVLETKGKGFADQPGFVARRDFVEAHFKRLNNEKFGYRRFDFITLRDDAPMDRNIAALAERMQLFFTEE